MSTSPTSQNAQETPWRLALEQAVTVLKQPNQSLHTITEAVRVLVDAGNSMHRELTDALSTIEQQKEDKERLDWLEKNHEQVFQRITSDGFWYFDQAEQRQKREDTLRDAVDAARSSVEDHADCKHRCQRSLETSEFPFGRVCPPGGCQYALQSDSSRAQIGTDEPYSPNYKLEKSEIFLTSQKDFFPCWLWQRDCGWIRFDDRPREYPGKWIYWAHIRSDKNSPQNPPGERA